MRITCFICSGIKDFLFFKDNMNLIPPLHFTHADLHTEQTAAETALQT